MIIKNNEVITNESLILIIQVLGSENIAVCFGTL